ncbi:MAG: type II secretion system protein [Terriglobales bacterium]
MDCFSARRGLRSRNLGVRATTGASRRTRLGFTLVEMLIVIAIMTILMAMSVPRYQAAVLHAKESVLRDDLFQLRSLIDQYTLDKQRAPQSLDDLVSAGYLRSLPKDPMTDSTSSWHTDSDESLQSLDQQEPGIVDVHSGSDAVSSDGTPYSNW